MRKGLFFFIFLLIAAFPCFVAASENTRTDSQLDEARQTYAALSKQADEIMNNPINVPAPPSISISCADDAALAADNQTLDDFKEAFNDPEGLLCARILEVQRQLELLGDAPGSAAVAGLADRLMQKALLLIESYGADIEKIPAISKVAMQIAADVQALGLDQNNRSAHIMDALAAMYEKAIDEMFLLLVQEHDYTMVRPILDAAQASLLLSDASGVDADEILHRLQNAMRFVLTINYYFEQTGNHCWVEQAEFEVTADFEGYAMGKITGTGTGSMVSFVWDENPAFTVTAPDFSVQAILENLAPCKGVAEILLTPFHPLSETAHFDGESFDWPVLKAIWETAFANNLQENGLYRFPLTFHNLSGTAVSQTLAYSVPDNEVRLEILLVHQPSQ